MIALTGSHDSWLPRPDTPPSEAAQSYATRGFSTFPCWWPDGSGRGFDGRGGCACGNPRCTGQAKHELRALAPNGLANATTDPAVIADWWRRYPLANVAIRTGAISGVLVIDIDPQTDGVATRQNDGVGSFQALEQSLGRLPDTLRANSGGGGAHLIFRHPGCGTIASRGSRIAPGVDVRGNGHYIIAAPSRHVSGGRYAWAEGPTTMADLPAAWIEALRSRRQVVSAPVRR